MDGSAVKDDISPRRLSTMQTTRSFASRIPADAFRVAAGIGFAVLVYFALEFVTWRAYYAMECEKMFSSTCMSLLQVKHIVAAALPAYLTGRWIGRLGIVLGATVSLGGWLTVNLVQALFGPNSFDAWHLVGNYLVIGALAGGIAQLHRPRAGDM